MNYATHYERLIARARSRVLSGYVERHHVLPTCIGGTDELSNLVALTPEEHYVAHQLLVKMHPGNESLLWAAMCMTGKSKTHEGRRNNKLYGWLRRRLAERVSSRLKGKPKTKEHRAALAAAKLGKKRGPQSEQQIAKRVASTKLTKVAKGRASCFDDPVYRAKQAQITKERWTKWKSGEVPRPKFNYSP